jgi:hypothetical protein
MAAAWGCPQGDVTVGIVTCKIAAAPADGDAAPLAVCARVSIAYAGQAWTI